MDQHVLADLSAYADDELAAPRRAEIDAHLGSCASCAARLRDLRGTARLIAAAPAARPARRLVPPLRERYSWLRPLRSLSAVASGAFVLLFVGSATLATGYRFGMEFGTSAPGAARAVPAAAPAPAAERQGPAAAPLATGSTGALADDAARRALSAATAAPTASEDPAKARRDTAQTGGATGSPFDAPLATGRVEPLSQPAPPQLGPTPLLWLALALISATVAVAAHRRLRAA